MPSLLCACGLYQCLLSPVTGTVARRLADKLAAQLCLDPGLPARGAAAIRSELTSAIQRNGNCYMLWDALQSATIKMLHQTGAAALLALLLLG